MVQVSGHTEQTTDRVQTLGRFSVLDTQVDATTKTLLISALESFAGTTRFRQIVTVNVDFLRLSEENPRLKSVINKADLAVTDGAPLVWIARLLGFRSSERITGPDVIDAFARIAVETGKRLFFLGGSLGSAEEAKRALESRFPGLTVAGAYCPPESSYPFPREVEEAIAMRIREAQPDVLFVGFGCPKQELWIDDHRSELDGITCIGIGGSFNFLAGRISRAPSSLQHFGLEWVYRLWREPRRLWRRYLLHDLPFMIRLGASEAMGRSGISRLQPSRRFTDMQGPIK